MDLMSTGTVDRTGDQNVWVTVTSGTMCGMPFDHREDRAR